MRSNIYGINERRIRTGLEFSHVRRYVERKAKSKRQVHRKYTAMVLSTVNLDRAAVGFHNGTRDAEPQPRALFTPRHGYRRPIKALEDPFLFLRGETDTSIRDTEDGAGASLVQCQSDAPAGRRVFDAVIYKVQEQSSEVLLIALNRYGGQWFEV